MWEINPYQEVEKKEVVIPIDILEEENKLDIEKIKKDILKTITISSKVDEDIITNGFKVIVGDKVLTYDVVSVENNFVEKEIEENIKKKYQEKLFLIKEAIEQKLESVTVITDTLKQKYTDEIEKLKIENNKTYMPDITYDHAKKGLSVVAGLDNDLIWLYNAVYQIKTIDNKEITKELSDFTITPIIVMIRTNDASVIEIETKNFNNLSDFEHYHKTGGGMEDCWGDWDWQDIKYNSIDDIIKIGKKAIEILSNINSGSIGDRNPVRLPGYDILYKALDPEYIDRLSEKYNKNLIHRLTYGNNNETRPSSVWSS
jgi:hypothetical protein